MSETIDTLKTWQNRPISTKSGNGGLRDMLLDIAAAANDALYTTHATPAEADKAYADALADIRKWCFPGMYRTPPAVFDAVEPVHEKRTVKLSGLWCRRVDGRPHKDGTRSVYGAFVRTVFTGTENFEMFRDNVRVARGVLFCGHARAYNVVRGMLQSFISVCEHAMRQRRNRAARRAAATGEVTDEH